MANELQQVIEESAKQVTGFLEDTLGTSDLKKFDPEQYVPRTSIEAQVTKFVIR